jgi:hypothetical protein
MARITKLGEHMQNPVSELIKSAVLMNLSAYDIIPLIKKATGEDIDPSQLQAMMQSMQGGGMPQGGMPMQHGGGDEMGELQQAIPNLSPEELQQLAQEISQFLQQEESQQGGAQSDASSSPDAPGDGAVPKQAGLRYVISAPYIEGFLKVSIDSGLFPNVQEAVDFYGDRLLQTAQIVKSAETIDKMSLSITPKTAQYCEELLKEGFKRGLDEQQIIGIIKQNGVYDQLLTIMDSELKH